MTNIGGGRALRVCDLCGGVDDHPRHVIANTVPRNLATGQNAAGPDGEGFPAPGDDIINKVIEAAPPAERARLLRDLQDTSSSERHLDCCAAAGCPTGTCGAQVADAPGTGRKMLDHVMSLADPFEDRADVVKAE